MEEFQEAEILWPGSNCHGDSKGSDATGGDDGGDGAALMLIPSVHRPKAVAPRSAAPVEISRRKRRCRPWPSSEHDTLEQETDASDDDGEEGRTDEAKGATSGLLIVPPHVLVARRRLGGGRTAAYSMCAGKGRTLKGRDLRDVRNLVLKMTGFIEK
ncbi:hypothetical protein BS78_09G212500 [Paspalum vaginatum]|nr:hypothetical protein BS78_09G212500 [Paspalum vaginatum]